MTKYNTNNKAKSTKTINHQGGKAYNQEDKIAFVSMLAVGIDKSYYETTDEKEVRLIELMNSIAKTDKYFLAQAIVYARTVMGQRTITHRAAVHLASLLNGETWGKDFFSKRNKKENKGGIIFRLDDLTEITACYFHLNQNKPLSNPIKKGFKQSLEAADNYEIAKYQANNKNVSLVDIVRLVHPKTTESNSISLPKLIAGDLRQSGTVEDKNSEAGQIVKNLVNEGSISVQEAEDKVKELKADNFRELILTKKIGYMSLLRNLRNILTNAPELIDPAGILLTDRNFVKKSLVFPHQIDLALEVIMSEVNTNVGRRMVSYINKAYEIAVDNVKELFNDGRTAVVVDTSGSMRSTWNSLMVNGKAVGTNRYPIDKAALIGATLAKGIDADLFQFATNCIPVIYNPMDSINTITNTIKGLIGNAGHGTAFSSIFNNLNERYDRVFVISDMQGGDNMIGNNYAFFTYKKNFGADPIVYSIDLCGYGNTMFNQNSKLCTLSGYGKDIYESAKRYEIDPNALINEIREIVI